MNKAIYLSILLITGCVAVPKTKISGSLGGQPFTLEAPKDGDLQGLELSAETNGSVHMHIDHLTVKMNPDVISQTASGQVQIINATGDVVAKGISAAIQAGGKAAIP